MVFSALKRLFGRSADAPATAAPRQESPAAAPVVAPAVACGPVGEPDVVAFVEYVVRSLVDAPDAVKVTPVAGDRQTTVQVTCEKRDIGKVIGKSGKTIAAIRVLVAGASARQGKKVSVEILD